MASAVLTMIVYPAPLKVMVLKAFFPAARSSMLVVWVAPLGKTKVSPPLPVGATPLIQLAGVLQFALLPPPLHWKVPVPVRGEASFDGLLSLGSGDRLELNAVT